MPLTTTATALLLLSSCFLGVQSSALANSYKLHQQQSGVACYGICSVADRGVLNCANQTRRAQLSHPVTSASADKAVAWYFGIYGGHELHIGLLNRHVTAESSLSVSSLYGPESLRRQVDTDCRLVDYVTVHMDSCCAYHLLPGSLDAFGPMKRLTLQMRFSHDRIPAGVFTPKLACLQNLQIGSKVVSEIAPGAFKELLHLTRLHISNLNVSHLTSTILHGLHSLRYLELPGNSLVSLDAASFAASSRLLEFINLSSKSAPGLATVASDTFCGLPKLELLEFSGSLNLSCSGFQSSRIRLSHINGSQRSGISCTRSPGIQTDCKAEGSGMAKQLSPDSSAETRIAMVCGDAVSTAAEQDAAASSLTTPKATPESAAKPTSTVARGKHVATLVVSKTTVSSATATASNTPMPPIKTSARTPTPSTVRNPIAPALTSAVFTTLPSVSTTGRLSQGGHRPGAAVTVTAVATIASVLLAASVAIFIGVAWRRRRQFGPAGRSLSLVPLVEDDDGDL